MFRILAALAAVAGGVLVAASASAAPFCKALKGDSVGFGEPSSRKEADEALDKEIKAWGERYHVAPKPTNRKVACKVYIQALNEFACTAEASVCRDIAAAAKKKP